ncbi:PREDICTED: V-type proton ATPase subunit S1-like protein [Condylura cristata]|uniref:V-type proton ATPase subunit S1-like protein n=1 Tax=Condylura cristata TaxID=143302 RepID=UPI000643441E|nr:PREDICTED: V-type proton ATPase subunit S1-like protein [Condylura cristata]
MTFSLQEEKFSEWTVALQEVVLWARGTDTKTSAHAGYSMKTAYYQAPLVQTCLAFEIPQNQEKDRKVKGEVKSSGRKERKGIKGSSNKGMKSFISRKSSNKEVVINSDQENNGDMKPTQNSTMIPITQVTQVFNYSLNKQRHLDKESWNTFSHQNPVNVSIDGIPCILFWAKRITIKFKNQTQLDLTEEAFGQKAIVDAGNSKCSEESATLFLKFGDAENAKGLALRFTLTNYNKLTIQSWFSLNHVEIIFNNSIQATFNATGVYAPASYSYHCHRVSNLQRYDAFLLPSDVDEMLSLWEVTFVDFQIQGFTIKGGQFAKVRDCASSFSPAILIGLAMSLILLLVLAYALHMLIYLRYLDRHYDFIGSPAHFPQLKAQDAAEEKELLRSQGVECYELRNQQICKIYV